MLQILCVIELCAFIVNTPPIHSRCWWEGPRKGWCNRLPCNCCFSVIKWCLTLQCHGLKHARLLYSSLSPGVCSNSCPLSKWCHPTVSSSVTHSLAVSLPQHQGFFQWLDSLHQVVKVLELQPQHQSFQWIFRTDFLQAWLVWSLCCPRDFQEPSQAPQFKSINSSAVNVLMVQHSHLYLTTGNTIALTLWTFPYSQSDVSVF